MPEELKINTPIMTCDTNRQTLHISWSTTVPATAVLYFSDRPVDGDSLEGYTESTTIDQPATMFGVGGLPLYNRPSFYAIAATANGVTITSKGQVLAKPPQS